MINSIKDLKNFVNDKNFKKVFFLCGEKSFTISGAKKIFEQIKKNKEVSIFLKKSHIPIYDELIEIIHFVQKFKPDLIIAIGGGAIIDYAKIANVVEYRQDLKNLIINYSYPFEKKFTKLIVIPTTAGSGAEVTSNAVIYINKIKYSFESELLVPDNYFLIPEFLLTAPDNIKASAGFDAIAQALESLVSKKSNDKSLEFAIRSLNISLENYLKFLDTPNIKNASEMSIAANLAGKAISISKTTAPHATSYPFTSLFNINHGHAVSLFFEKFFRFNFENLSKSETNFDLSERFNLIFKVFKVRNINEFNLKISELKLKSNLECNLVKLNVDTKKNYKKILDGINLLRLGNNPVKIKEQDIYKIIVKE